MRLGSRDRLDWNVLSCASYLMVALGIAYGLAGGVGMLLKGDEEPSGSQLAVEQAEGLGFLPYLAPAGGAGPDGGDPLPAGAEQSSGDGWEASSISTEQQHSDSGGSAREETFIPDRLIIPAIQLDVPVVPVDYVEVFVGGQRYLQWLAPDQAVAGWHRTSAPLAEPGNTILNGHHNIHGEVFRDLEKLEDGDVILLGSRGRQAVYRVVVKLILDERNQSLEGRAQNAMWIRPSADERLTLVTCWPYESNTHRLIIMALPAPQER